MVRREALERGPAGLDPPRASGAHGACAERLGQATANTDAIGAIVEVRVGEAVLRHEVTVGGGHAGGRLGPVHVGLGPAARAELRVTWPDGTATGWMAANADPFVEVRREAAGVVPWRPPALAGGS